MTTTGKKMKVLETHPGAEKRCSSVLSAPRVAVFLENLSRRPNVSEAAYAAGLDRKALYKKKQADSAFCSAWDEAWGLGIESMEEEAERRASKGVAKGIYYKGRKIATERQYSDVLLMFMLKGAKPEKYRERHEHSGASGGPISFIIENSKE